MATTKKKALPKQAFIQARNNVLKLLTKNPNYFSAKKPATLKGTFVARSSKGDHGSYSLGTSVPGASVNRVPLTANTTPTNAGPGANWEMVIPAGTPKCGYEVRVWVGDRTIINSTHTGWGAGDQAGFCVR